MEKDYFKTDLSTYDFLQEERLIKLTSRALDQLEVFTFFDWPSSMKDDILKDFFSKWIINEPLYRANRKDALERLLEDQRFPVIIHRLTKIYDIDVEKLFIVASTSLLH